ncbi:aprataxin and PNK-like factor [Cloeon dipterum]|uniref:aprataxin and PNK-like factor n=1 Tax=Cloeon dipterum TaxID=197152 RepID=UPI00321F8341
MALKRPVQFLDDLSSDEDDYYENQRKKALMENSTPEKSHKCAGAEGSVQPDEVIGTPDTSFSGDDNGNEVGKVDEDEVPEQADKDEVPEQTDEEDTNEDRETGIVRAACAYGASCYRRNPQHKADFSHPGDPDYAAPGPSQGGPKPHCQYGTSCYRKNPQHKIDFDHSMPPTLPDKPKKQLRAKTKDKSNDDDDEYESDFIDDEEEEEEEDVEESDEEWEPDHDDNE